VIEGKTIYEFGDFRLDTAKETLQRDGLNIPITRKTFETLNVLVENADRLVEKEELMQTIWHDRFVEESNLTFNIKMLRKALGDSAGSPTYIETIPRRGYRFIAEVRAQPHTNGNISAETTVVPIAGGGRSAARYFIPVIISAIVVAGIIAAAVFYREPQLSGVAGRMFPSGFTSTKMTDTGNIHHAVISPDGKYVAYVSSTSGRQGLWLRHLETSSNTSVLPSADETYYGLTFSHDSQTLFFVRLDTKVSTGLYRVPIFGGVPTKIASSMQGGVNVLPDDKRVSFVRMDQDPSGFARLFTADLNGTDEREIQLPERCRDMKSHSFAPDGKRLAIACGTSSHGSQEMSIVELDLTTGVSRELTSDRFFHIADVDWLPNGAGLIFTAGKTIGERGKIWQLDLSGDEIVPLTSDLTHYTSISLSDDMHSVVATTTDPDFYLYNQIVDGASGFRMLTQARDRFSFASDGRIVYSSDTAGNADIWIMDPDGSNQRQLTNDKSPDWEPLVSPDVRYVFFASSRTGRNEIWRMNMDGSDQIQLTQNGGGFPRLVTPDEEYLYYDPTGSFGLMRIPVNGGTEESIAEGGQGHTLTPDGRRLAYLYLEPDNTRQIAVQNVGDAEVLYKFKLPEGNSNCHFLRWLTPNSLAYMVVTAEGDRQILSQSLDGGKPRFVRSLGREGILDVEFPADTQRPAFIRGEWKHDAVLLSVDQQEISRTSH